MLNKETINISVRLFIITAIAALCLALVNKITSPVIAKNQQAVIEAAQKEVLPEAETFKAVDYSNTELETSKNADTEVLGFFRGQNKNGPAGYVVTVVSKQGYGGNIKIMVGINEKLEINKVKITESGETAGLGLKASNPEFIDQFIGRNEALSVIKNSAPTESGTDIAAISGATVTSKAVTNAVNTAIELVKIKAADASQEGFNDVEAIKDKISKETEKQLKEGK